MPGPKTEEPISWNEFKGRVTRHASRPLDERLSFWFRGQADPRWALLATLDRRFKFDSDEQRTRDYVRLLRSFWREAAGLHTHLVDSPISAMGEVWARHYGLPTTLLDWTLSPYVAAYFAYDDEPIAPGPAVSVWVFKRAVFAVRSIADIELIEPDELVVQNARVGEQRSVMMRMLTREPAESLLGDGLQKILLRSEDRRQALIDLDAMNINARTMFRDLNGAARTAIRRLEDFGARP